MRVVSGAGPWSGPFPAVYIEALAAVDDLVGTGRLDEAHMLAADAVTAAEVDGERPALQAVLLQRLAEVALRQGKVWEVGSLHLPRLVLTHRPTTSRTLSPPARRRDLTTMLVCDS